MNILPQNILNHIQPNRNLQSGFPVYSPVGGAGPIQDTFNPGGLPSPDSLFAPESYGPAGPFPKQCLEIFVLQIGQTVGNGQPFR